MAMLLKSKEQEITSYISKETPLEKKIFGTNT